MLSVDMHSHLLPGIDDGVKSFEESILIIQKFIDLGYRKIITTPHIMYDHYRNTPQIILQKLTELRQILDLWEVTNIQIEAAAEYYLDEYLMNLLDKNEKLLTFGNNYLLFETNFLSEPFILNEFIFKANSKGYRPVLAHPERYQYLMNNMTKVQGLIDRSVLFQVNAGSITGYYGKPIMRFVKKLIKTGNIHLIGSDCHHEKHIQMLHKAIHTSLFQEALRLPLLNNQL